MSSSSTASKHEKEKQKLIQEKCQSLLNEMLRDDDNKYCVDCDAKGPRWASWNLGIFLCIRCAGIHRNLGVHISRVKSVNLDTWTPEQVVTIEQMGNSRARAVYEANLPDTFRRPQTDVALENFIRAKYETKKYIAQEWVQAKTAKVNWDSEIEAEMRKKKESKRQQQMGNDIGPLPTAIPKPKPSNSPSTPGKLINVSKESENGKPIQISSPSDDLLGLTTTTIGTENSLLSGLADSSDPFASPHKSAAANSGGADLVGIFSSNDSALDLTGMSQKMTNASIMSLYGTPASTPVNPFGSPQMFAGSPQNFQIPGNNPMNNPFPVQQQQQQQGQQGLGPFGNNLQGQIPPQQISTPFGIVPSMPPSDNIFGPTISSDVNSVQQQLFGLNMSNTSFVPNLQGSQMNYPGGNFLGGIRPNVMGGQSGIGQFNSSPSFPMSQPSQQGSNNNTMFTNGDPLKSSNLLWK